MRAKPMNRPVIEDLIEAIPSCALDEAGRLEQYARYGQLARTVSRVERQPETIVVQFDERLDRELLERALLVERECCPFFVFHFEESEQRLAMGVRQRDQLPALEAIAAAFAAVQQAGAESERGA